MAFATRVASLIRNLTRRTHVERQLDEELRATVEMLAAEKMRAGQKPDEARRAALADLGGIEPIKEQVRDVRSGAMLDTLGQDIRYAARLLRRYPVFALIAALSLAVGIGANTTVFTIGTSLLRFAPAAVTEPDRIVDIGRRLDGVPVGFNPGSYPDYLDIRRRSTTLEHVYARTLFPRDMVLDDSTGAQKVVAEVVTTNYFATLGARPRVGRLFHADESDRPNESPIVVLSHRFWSRRFNADPAIVGKTVRVNRVPMTVVGVAAEGFQGTTIVAPDLWVPLGMTATESQLGMRRSGWVTMGARLAAGATMAQAAAELDVIDRALREEYPGQDAARSYRLQPASPMAGNLPVAAAAVLLLGAIATTILVIACANVAGLLLARASARRREMALRLAIGAGRWRLVRQLLTETLMLFALGSAAGVALARVMASMVMGLLPVLPIPVQISIALDWRVVAFASGLSLVAALLSGLAPALHASRADVSTVLKAESPGASVRTRLRHAFVIAQVACSLLLIVIGSLFTRALQQAGGPGGAGFDSSGVEVTMLDSFIAADVLERVRRLPGVESASLVRFLPLASEGFGFGLSLPGAVKSQGDSGVVAGSGNVVAPGYFTAMRIPLLAGRDFTEQDGPGAPEVAVIGEAAARRFWPGQDAVGQRLVLDGAGHTGAVLQVIGVARDIRYRNMDFGSTPFVYLPFRQFAMPQTALVVRSAGRSLARPLRQIAADVDPALPPIPIQRLDDVMAVGLAPQRIVAFVAGSLGLIGVLLAAIGVYGITALSVARRTREIAVRTALGAQRGAIARLVVRQALSLTGIGIVGGLALGVVAGQVLSMLLIGVSPFDPLALSGAVVLCVAVTLLACYVPLRRAMRISASDALRAE